MLEIVSMLFCAVIGYIFGDFVGRNKRRQYYEKSLEEQDIKILELLMEKDGRED